MSKIWPVKPERNLGRYPLFAYPAKRDEATRPSSRALSRSLANWGKVIVKNENPSSSTRLVTVL
jgi:hypothetical protein